MVYIQRQRAFSLVELSIVLVILGLLTGGILAGQSLIRAAELRSVGTDYSRYLTATQTFRDKYFAIPGDMNNATLIWGKDNTYCAGDTGTAAINGTCNGNNDGVLVLSGAVVVATGERFQFWKQLALAGLIEGQYSGLSLGTNDRNSLPGTNVPKSKLNNGGWWDGTITGVYAGDALTYATEYGNYFVLGGAVSGDWPGAKILKPEEAWNIDSKMDDGKPARGRLITNNWNNECSVADDGGSANNDLVASYKLSDTSAQCVLYFVKSI